MGDWWFLRILQRKKIGSGWAEGLPERMSKTEMAPALA